MQESQRFRRGGQVRKKLRNRFPRQGTRRVRPLHVTAKEERSSIRPVTPDRSRQGEGGMAKGGDLSDVASKGAIGSVRTVSDRVFWQPPKYPALPPGSASAHDELLGRASGKRRMNRQSRAEFSSPHSSNRLVSEPRVRRLFGSCKTDITFRQSVRRSRVGKCGRFRAETEPRTSTLTELSFHLANPGPESLAREADGGTRFAMDSVRGAFMFDE